MYVHMHVCITGFPQCFVYVRTCAVIWISGVYIRYDDRIGTVEPCVIIDSIWHVRILHSNTTYVDSDILAPDLCCCVISLS